MNKYSRQKASTYALYRHANRGSASFIAPESTIAHFMDFTDPSAYVDALGQAWQNIRHPGDVLQGFRDGVSGVLGGAGGVLQKARLPVPPTPDVNQLSGVYQGLQQGVHNIGQGIQQGIQGIGEGLKNFLPPSIPSPSGAERLSDIPGAIPKQPDFLHKASDAIGNAYNRVKGYVTGHPGVSAATLAGGVAAGAGGLGLRQAAKRRGMRLAAQQAAAAAQQTPNLMQRAQALAGNPMARNLGIGALALGGLGAGVAGLNALARKDAYEQADYNHALTNQYVASFSRGNGTRFAARTY